ncbi:TIGR00159 family protein [Megasphaera sp. UPII 135-E]|nr:TIGR00159 family protein [Megasphaera sp. UPII 135-E]MUP59368.1 TIGR00159 family protein [Veillonellaceae bacterium M2-4]
MSMYFPLQGLISSFRLLDIIDILLVAFVLYKLYYLIYNTRAVALIKGLLVLGIVTVVSKVLDLHVINWLLQQGMTVILVALPVVFQPELRRALEQIGRGHLFRSGQVINAEELEHLVDEVVAVTESLSKTRTGALLVFEREVGLNDYIDTGIFIQGIVSRELLGNIFIPNTPLHDGAVIIRENEIMAAGCLLPLTSDRSLSTELGTRHRAAIGISEITDAVVVVVSEETGAISYTYGGHIYRHLEAKSLHKVLLNFLRPAPQGLVNILKWRPLK